MNRLVRKPSTIGLLAGIAVLALTAPARAQRLHVLAVGDTNDPRIGSYCEADLADLEQLFRSNVPAERLAFTRLSGNQVTSPGIFQAIDRLQPQPNDAVVFYYSGHGAMDQFRQHYIALRGSRPLYRADVRRALEAKRTRLAVLLTDICSVMVPVRPKTFMFSAPPPSQEASPLFLALFFEARGVADINGSSPGEVGLCDPSKLRGGLFTFCFSDVLAENSGSRLTWQQVLDRTRARVDEVFRQGWPDGYDLTRDGLSGVQRTQTPYAVALPGTAGVAFGAYALENNGNGVLIARVDPGTPAHRSGLEPRDIILEMNGRPIRSTGEYVAAVRSAGPELRYRVRNWRNGQIVELTAQLAAKDKEAEPATNSTPGSPPAPTPEPPPPAPVPAPEPPPPARSGPVFGATCKNTPDGRGVRVTRIVPGSPAARAGLEPNDLLTAINGRTIRNEEDYAKAIDESGPVAQIVAINHRDGQIVRFSVRLNKD